MKIIIPFDPEEFFSLEDISLMHELQLNEGMVIDQVLQNWETYVTGSVEEVYERTVDELYEWYESKYRDTDEGIRLQLALAEHSDALTELLKTSALKLHQLLDHVPDQVERMTRETGEFHFLRVSEINPLGRYAVIESDVIDNPL